MALTANKDPQTKPDEILAILVEDNVHIYRGAAVCANAAGYAIPATDTDGNVFIGIAMEECDNTVTGHTQGGQRVQVFRPGSAVFSKATAAQTDVGLEAFISDDETVVLAAAGTEGVHVGTVIEVPDSSHVRVALRGARPFSFMYGMMTFHVNLADVADGDVITTITPGFVGELVKTFWVQGTPVTTGSKASSLNWEIGTTDVTGGAIALTSAACTPLGKVIAGAAMTAGVAFGASSTISLEASSTTAFAEGDGMVVLVYKQLLQ